MDQALKQRLVGATVLIMLAIVLLPMLLSGGGDLQGEASSIAVPDKPPELSIEKRRFPIGGQSAEEAPSMVPPAVEEEEDAAGDDAARGEGIAEAEVEAEAQVTTEPVVPEPETRPAEGPVTGPGAPVEESAALSIGRYLVQVASFSNRANADQLSNTLTGAGLPVVRDEVDSSAGRLHRVRTGPYDGVEDATATMEQIRLLVSDVNPRVVDLRPDEDSAVTEPSDPMVRWAVQAGSFSGRANADELAAQLKLNGFDAYVDEVRSAGSGSSYKVRIGPLLERQNAAEQKRRLQDALGIDGIVVTVD